MIGVSMLPFMIYKGLADQDKLTRGLHRAENVLLAIYYAPRHNFAQQDNFANMLRTDKNLTYGLAYGIRTERIIANWESKSRPDVCCQPFQLLLGTLLI